MPAYPLDLWTPSCMMTWKCGKFLQDGFRECWPMKTRLHASQCVRQCYHMTRVWIVFSFHQLSQWMRHGCRCSILKPNGNWLNGSTPTHCHRRNFVLPPVLRKWWQLRFGTEKAWYLLIAFPRVQQWWVRLMKMCYEKISSSIAWKTAQKGCSCVLSSWQRFSSLGGSCSPVFRGQQLWSCFSCSVLTWPRIKRFLAVSNTKGHSSWSHIFELFRSCNRDFPVVTTNP